VDLIGGLPEDQSEEFDLGGIVVDHHDFDIGRHRASIYNIDKSRPRG
jgi:hypothetical protein